MRKALALALVLGTTQVWAAPKEEEEETTEEEEEGGGEEGGGEEEPEEPEEPSDDRPDGPVKAPAVFKKQNLTGHADDDKKANNLFEKDRFFVDKVDSEKTSKKTLIQGSLTGTTFGHRESGGTIGETGVPSNSPYTRLFTEVRLQTDFRHIGGGKWDARFDGRARYSADPGTQTPEGANGPYVPPDNSTSQSGFLGENELEIRELWLARSGKRTDVFFGRQFIADLAGVKFDGLRFDYAASSKFTYLGFGGLYPIRGSRSIMTDYEPLKSLPDSVTGIRADAGRFTGAGGFGAAYRTQNMYGAFGGVALVPFSSESPRIFATSTGYWRAGPKLDFYHFGVLDAIGPNGVALTNLSAGLNLKPDQRLRGTLAVHRVDTETLNVQAQAFLQDPNLGQNFVQNESYLIRIAQNSARASLSAGLGSLQRFELTIATTFRYRGEVDLTSPQNMVVATLPAGKSLEVYGALTDRRSFANLRLGVDGSRIIKVGDVTYQRTASTSLRAFAARELKNGHGEWEGEVTYTTTKDDNAGVVCVDIATCFGAAESTVISLGGNLFYRLNRNWFAMGSLFLNRYNITSVNGGVVIEDPAVYGLSGFGRIAYRF
jgi:hypothetical protein